MKAKNIYLIFVALLVLTVVLFVTYLVKTGNLPSLTSITPSFLSGDISTESNVEGISLRSVDDGDFENFISETVKAGGGIRKSYESTELVTPKSFKFVLTNEPQRWGNVAMLDKHIEERIASMNYGFEFNDLTKKLTLYLYFHPEFVASLSKEEFGGVVNKNVREYLFRLSGDKISKLDNQTIFAEIEKFQKENSEKIYLIVE